MFSHCQNCLRKLTDPKSRRDGFGPECREALGYQQTYLDAGCSAVDTGATADSRLCVLRRILQRSENTLLQFREEQMVPLSIVRNLRKIRQDFELRARHLQKRGELFVPEPVTASAVMVTAHQSPTNERATFG